MLVTLHNHRILEISARRRSVSQRARREEARLFLT